jgi:hypothetical protein
LVRIREKSIVILSPSTSSGQAAQRRVNGEG